VGKQLSDPVMTEYAGGHASLRKIFGEYPHEALKVKWLNRPTKGTKNMQFGYITVSTKGIFLLVEKCCWSFGVQYSNEAGSDFAYSSCTLLFNIPAYAERVKVRLNADVIISHGN
jgi:hypothetical protein